MDGILYKNCAKKSWGPLSLPKLFGIAKTYKFRRSLFYKPTICKHHRRLQKSLPEIKLILRILNTEILTKN